MNHDAVVAMPRLLMTEGINVLQHMAPLLIFNLVFAAELDDATT